MPPEGLPPRVPVWVVVLELVICHLLAALLVWVAAPILELGRGRVLMLWCFLGGLLLGLCFAALDPYRREW